MAEDISPRIDEDELQRRLEEIEARQKLEQEEFLFKTVFVATALATVGGFEPLGRWYANDATEKANEAWVALMRSREVVET